MKDKEIRTLAAYVIMGIIFVPIVINTSMTLINMTYVGVVNTMTKVRFKKQIKKGLKDGSIVEIDGGYYEVVIENPVH